MFLELPKYLGSNLISKFLCPFEGYLKKFLNIFLVFYFLKHLLPFLYALLLEPGHTVSSPFSLGMFNGSFLHLEFESSAMAPGTFDGQFLYCLYVPGIFLADVVAMGPNNLFGSESAPGSLDPFGACVFEDVVGCVVRPYFVFLCIFLLYLSHLDNIHFRHVGLNPLVQVPEALQFLFQLVGIAGVFYDVVLFVDCLLQN